jgi:ABC-2 type transport system permease protein
VKKEHIFHILENDFKNFFRYKWWLVGLVSMNLADLFIMAIIYNRMLNPEVARQIKSYFDFFAPGLTVTGLFASAFMIGREVNMEKRTQYYQYLLSLPMSRFELAFGRVLSGGLRGIMYMSPLLLTCFAFIGLPTSAQLLIILCVLFFLAMGISGLSIAIAVSTRSIDKFVTARGLIYYLLFFCSSVFYPLSLIEQLGREGKFPTLLVQFARINPLSNAADLIRSFLLGTPPFSFGMVVSVLAFSTIFICMAASTYIKLIEKP